MAEPGDAVSEKTLTSSLTLLLNTSRAILDKAKLEAQESLQSFAQHKITNLLGLIAAGVQFYKSLGVKKRSEAESVWQRVYHHAEVRDQVEELLELECEWDSFIQSVDEDLQAGAAQSAGRSAGGLSLQMPLTDGSSGKSVTLGQYLERGQKLLLVLIRHYGWLPWRDHVAQLQANQSSLDAQSVRVLVVSFGSLEGSRFWLEQTGCTFNVVLDPQRTIYQNFGLGSSYSRVMKFDCLLTYSEYGAVDRNFPDVPPNLLEDIYQMGGDFMLDDRGTVVFRYPCENPLDRPSVEHILQAAQQPPKV